MAFDPNAVKSATENGGSFDRDDPNMLSQEEEAEAHATTNTVRDTAGVARPAPEPAIA